ncbi:MAG: hypothetical protein LBP85_01605 [Prevotellaceae bacterium]|jgi:hypothetical protein|nr:hypothetical protein [Prevotellaceae bacterium]
MKKLQILIIALTLISCSTKKVTTAVTRENLSYEKTADSTATKQIIKEVKVQPVSADTAKTKVAVSAVENLPEGAKFTEKSGRASVQLIRIKDTVIITAICDSLQRLIYSYELEIENYSKKIEQKNSEIATVETETKKKTYNPFLSFGLGVVAGALIILIFASQKSILDTILNIIKKLFK